MTAINAAIGNAKMGGWELSWDIGEGEDFGVTILSHVPAVGFREVWGTEQLAQASRPHRHARWKALLERELARLREFANADAAKTWQPELERLDFREAHTLRLVGYVHREAGKQTCPFCEGPLDAERMPLPDSPIHVVQRWRCECGFEWKRRVE